MVLYYSRKPAFVGSNKDHCNHCKNCNLGGVSTAQTNNSVLAKAVFLSCCHFVMQYFSGSFLDYKITAM
jgi:hypothetical protein